MIKFTANSAELKTALSIISLGTDDTLENIRSHALFILEKERAFIYATNEDKIATAVIQIIPINAIEEEKIKFTASPKKILALLSSTNLEMISFTYEETTKTLNIYASEDPDAYISFASFDPESSLSFDKELNSQKELKKINTEIFLMGIKFIQGFLPKDDKDKKYSNLYINNSIFHGSNGTTKIGALKCSDLEGINNISLRRMMLSGIATFIDKINTPDLLIKESKKFTTFFSSDNTYCFGFKKTTGEIPNLPISLDIPNTDGFNVECNKITKKLNRLVLASPENFAIKFKLIGNDLSMETITDRVSYEKMVCQRIGTIKDDIEFIMESNMLQKILNLFEATNVDIYVDKKKCTIYSVAEIIIGKDKEQIKKPFIAVGLVTQARII